MLPLWIQRLLLGSSSPPQSRPTTPDTSDAPLSTSPPYLLPPGREASHVSSLSGDPETHTTAPSSLGLTLSSGYSSFHQTSHVQGVRHRLVAPDSPPVMFGPNSRFMLNGGNTTFQQHSHVYQEHHIGGIQILYQNSSPGAAYCSKDRYDPPKCHPNTRTGLLNTTRDWAHKGPSRIMWLYGSAGAGKSAVAQTMSMEFRTGENLAASFFFSRTAPPSSHRGHEGRFVTTIAYQLTEVVPGLHRYMEQVIASRPSVFDLTLTEQVTALIIDPLKALQLDMGTSPFMLPRVIVVDGLDECKEESGQIQVLEAIATLVGYQDVFPCSVFLASRPELVIRSWITTKQSGLPHLLQSISLLDHCDSDHDIAVFVNDEAAKLKESHPLKYLIPDDWPSSKFVEEIVRRACGQFIYASTIMKYIKDLRGSPSDRLKAILCNTIPNCDRPYAELDTLYLYILRQTQHPNLVRQVLAFCVSTRTFVGRIDVPDSRTYLQNLLSLPFSVHVLLIDLQSIINCSVDRMQFMAYAHEQRPYPSLFHHASLLEFLLDPHRSKEFHIDVPRFDKELCEITLQHLGGEIVVFDLRRAVSEFTTAFEAGPVVTDEQYVMYCFLILLQTRTSYHSSYRDKVITRLAQWDDLNNEMLYVTLCRLTRKCSSADKAERFVNIIDRDLWTTFAPAVARMRAQCYQKIKNAGLPQELFVMYHTHLLGLYGRRLGRDLQPNVDAYESFDWHIKDCIQHRTGVDVWHFCSLEQHKFLMHEYWEPTWQRFMNVLDKYLPASEKETLQIEKLQRDAVFEWKTLALAVVVFSIKHLISMLENEAVSDHVKEKGGDNWRAITAALLLEDISHFIWRNCPISADIVLALEEISQKFFPPHVVSIMEDTTFPFDFPHPECESQKELLRSFSSPCALPRWFFLPPDFLDDLGGGMIRLHLGQLHDYIRLSIIYNGADPRLVHGFGTSWVYNPDKWCHDVGFKVYDQLGACELAETTTDPRTGLPIDLTNWSMWTKWNRFESAYEKAEKEHTEMKKRDPQPS